MADNQRQHYVPQFYLKYFTSDKSGGTKLWQYDMETGERSEKVPKSVCWKSEFYDLPSVRDHKAEKLFSDMESKQGMFLKEILQLVENNDEELLNTLEMRMKLSSILMLMFMRSPFFRKEANSNYLQLYNDFLKNPIVHKNISNHIEDDETRSFFDNTKLEFELTEDGKVGTHLATLASFDKLVELLSVDTSIMITYIPKQPLVHGCKCTFYTTDVPCARITVGDSVYSHGLNPRDKVYAMALSSQVNVIIGDPYVLKASPNTTHITALDLQDFIAMELLKKLNMQIIQNSHRFIYSADSNFILPRLMNLKN